MNMRLSFFQRMICGHEFCLELWMLPQILKNWKVYSNMMECLFTCLYPLCSHVSDVILTVCLFQCSETQKLLNIAKELLHTEEAYVKRLNLLDQVTFCLSVSL